MTSPACIVLTTAPNRAEADAIARRLVEDRLAACVQIVPIASVYRWDGKVRSDDELLLLCKSRVEVYPQLEATIRAIHSYETPEVLRVPVDAGLDTYLTWLGAETGANPAS
jgi:periplasmic divalent cation tolerance protein